MLRVAGEALLGVVDEAHLGLGGEDHRIDDERPRQLLRAVGVAAGVLGAVELLQLRQRRRALGLDDRGDVDAGEGRGDGELDGELVAGAGGTLDRRGQPRRDLRRPGIRDLPIHVTLLVDLTLRDEAVALEPVERVVDLTDVERPGRAGAAVELGAQLVSVTRSLIEDRQQALTYRHPLLRSEVGTYPESHF